MDLMLTILILFSILAPILQMTAYSSLHAHEAAMARQRLSIVLQIAQKIYSNSAAPRASLQSFDLSALPGPSYVKVGYLDPLRLPPAQAEAEAQIQSMGLTHFDLSLAPPALSNQNQICVQRLMLLPSPTLPAAVSSSISPSTSLPLPTFIPQPVWACGW